MASEVYSVSVQGASTTASTLAELDKNALKSSAAFTSANSKQAQASQQTTVGLGDGSKVA